MIKFIKLIIIALFGISCSSIDPTDNNEVNLNIPTRIVFHSQSGVMPINDLYIVNDSIHSLNLRHSLKNYKVRAAYSNRYDSLSHLQAKYNNSNYDNDWFLVDFLNTDDANKLLSILKKLDEIREVSMETKNMELLSTTESQNISDQWHLTKEYGINIVDAWKINKGRKDVTIAVCDGGVDYKHPNLDPGDRSRVIAGIDTGDNDNDPMDNLSDTSDGSYANHGTHIAGIIGATPSEKHSIWGVMQNCKIMPIKMVGSGRLKIKVFVTLIDWDYSTTAFPSDVANGIDYAVNNNANVINLSYGFGAGNIPFQEVVLKVGLLNSSIKNAYMKNVLVVASMGNDGVNAPQYYYPAAFPTVLAVGNTNINKQRAPSSSIGKHISVSAPGTNIKSTLRDGKIGNKSGTSMAAPVVSGLAGLIISQGKDRNMDLTNDDVRYILEKTANDIDKPGFDFNTGYGIVDAAKALSLLIEPNELITGVSKGVGSGRSTLLKTHPKWMIRRQTDKLDYMRGWMDGVYINVEQYEIKKHISFPKRLVSPPKHVWIRDRDTYAMSFDSYAYPYAEITNITEEGFDVRYAVYLYHNDLHGRNIDQWFPSRIEDSQIAYAALGEIAPNIRVLSTPPICNNSNIFVSANDLPDETSITWIGNSNLTLISGQGTRNATFRTGARVNGNTIVKATITTKGKAQTIESDPIWVGAISTNNIRITSNNGSSFKEGTYKFNLSVDRGQEATQYKWRVTGDARLMDPLNTSKEIYLHTYSSRNGGKFTLYCDAINPCETSTISFTGSIEAVGGGGDGPIDLPGFEKFSLMERKYSIEVFSFPNGVLIHQDEDGNNFNIQKNNISSGIYIIRKTFSDGTITNEKVMKK